jgi:hypothetical protein
MTRAEAEEKYLMCLSLVEVLGGDIREKCREKGIPEEFIQEFVQSTEAEKNAYDKFFEEHDAAGELQISEVDAVKKLKNFGVSAGVDKKGEKWIVLDGKGPVNSVILGLCKHLQKNYSYKYWNKKK